VKTSHGSRLLERGRELDRGGRLPEAAECYEGAVAVAESNGEPAVLAESLRRLGVVRHRSQESDQARELCRRSYDVALAAGDRVLAAEALNARAGFDLEHEAFENARATYGEALQLGSDSPALRGRIEQNLGIVANILGDLDTALTHYERSLAAFEAGRDDSGCAIAFHNLGMISADRGLWAEADRYFRRSLAMADELGDVRLRALCLLNHSEVLIAQQRYEEARSSAEAALRIFDQLGAREHRSGAYKFIGVVYRETGQPVLAEARFRSAIAFATEQGSVLAEAEAMQELARLHQVQSRNIEALELLNGARRLFRSLRARRDEAAVARHVAQLEGAYMNVVRDWGQSIESADSYTFGHCERVATYAIAIARALRLDSGELTTIRLGAYLHDLGKIRVPHEILNKPGRLTREEFEVMQMHPLYGVELLESVEFPWDIKPIIRWHHEKYDGTGYPDRLSGDQIPLAAQIICVADVYDALTTNRSYRGAMTPEAALEEMRNCRSWWRADVFAAFEEGVS